MKHIMQYETTQTQLKDCNYSLKKVRSLIINTLKCPTEFIYEKDRTILAIQKALKTQNEPLFYEAERKLSADYSIFCMRNELFVNDDNRRYRTK